MFVLYYWQGRWPVLDIYFQLAVCFSAIAASAFIAEKTRLFFAPFYIAAGILLGPSVLKLVTDTGIISIFGEIGLVFLLFFLGLEFSLHKLLSQKKAMITAGSIDFLINFGLGFAVGQIMGLSVLFSMAIACALYMSSSGIITKSLVELEINKNREGHLIMGIMVFEDLVMVLFLVLISVGFAGRDAMTLENIGIQLGKAFLFCFLLLVLGKRYSRWLDRLLGIKNRELLLLAFFGLVLLITASGKYFGVSEALCAFFLGIAFSNTKRVDNIKSLTVTFRDLFGSVFFFSFGVTLQLQNIFEHVDLVIYFLIIAVAGKLLSSFIISKIMKCEKQMGLFIGFITVPRGEFSLLISQMAAGAIPFIGPVMVIVVLLTTFISSLVLKFSKLLCKAYNLCIIFPRSRIGDGWGEVD